MQQLFSTIIIIKIYIGGIGVRRGEEEERNEIQIKEGTAERCRDAVYLAIHHRVLAVQYDLARRTCFAVQHDK